MKPSSLPRSWLRYGATVLLASSSAFAADAAAAGATPPPAPAAATTTAPAAPKPVDAEAEALRLPRQSDMSGIQALRFTSLFRPFSTDQAAMSPDGKYLAYTLREGGEMSVVVVEVSDPKVARSKVVVASDKRSTPMLPDLKEEIPATIRWMKWTSPTRLVLETNTNFVLDDGSNAQNPAVGAGFQNVAGSIVAFDADGQNAKEIVTPHDVPARFKDAAFVVEDRKAPMRSAFDGAAVWTIDQPVPGVAGIQETYLDVPRYDPFNAPPADGDPNATSVAPRARSPRILDLVPGKPDHVYITAGNPREYQVYILNTVTGKLENSYDEKVGEEYSLLLDRVGKARIGVPSTLRERLPHEYRLERFGGLSRWKKLDSIIPPDVASGFSLSPENFLSPRSIPLGFDDNPNLLFFATNVGRETYGIFGLDLEKGQRTGFVAENPLFDLLIPPLVGFADPNPLVFDRYTRQLVGIRYDARLRTAAWLRPELTEVQKFLEGQLRGKAIELLEWSEDGKRFLVLGRGPADPGSFYIFERETGKLSLFAARAPWLDEDRVHPTYDFAAKGPEGVTLLINVTMPREIRVKPVPMIVMCPTEPWLRTRSEYRTEVQVLANMGFAVVQVNGRGTWGFGTKQRELVRDGWEEKRVEDIVAACDILSQRLVVDIKRVGLYGEKRGGWLALRALQLRPGRFRGAVVIEPTIDPVNWAEQTEYNESDPTRKLVVAALGGAEHLKSVSLLRNAAQVTKPVLAMSYPGPRGAARTTEYINTRSFIAAVAKSGTPAELYELDDDYQARLPKSRSRAMREMETFFNASIYDFGVEVGDLKELK